MRSDSVKTGTAQAPHRSLFNALGYTEEERRRFRAYFQYFREAFDALGGRSLHIRAEEALLLWLQVHPFTDLGTLSGAQLKKTLGELWENVVAMDLPDLVVRTEAAGTAAKQSLFGRLWRPGHVNVAFVHQRTVETSPWTCAHDVGRKHLEDALGNAVTVRSYFGADTAAQAEALLEQAVADGAEVIFTTTPQLVAPSLKVSIRYPKVRFLNCSIHMPYSTVRTYYSRIYEGKFITGAIAGAMADNNRIGYVGSYPIFGVPASINAFALGAQLTNPRAQIELKWSCMPGNPTQEFIRDGIRVISNRDTPAEDKLHTEYGTYYIDGSGEFIPLGSPCWIWGKFYENVIRAILSGTWDDIHGQAVNDWWGMSSGAEEIDYSKDLPAGTLQLLDLMEKMLHEDDLRIFPEDLFAQGHVLHSPEATLYSPKELMEMDWLDECVEGALPHYDELDVKTHVLMAINGLNTLKGFVK